MPLVQEQFFDIGANLTHESFTKDLDSVITEASKLGVKRLSVTGSSVKDSLEAFEITQRYPCLLYTSPSPRDRQKSRMPSSA